MASGSRRIQDLPDNVRASVTSSVRILSLNDVVLELVKNALDANAADIKVSLDLVKGFCSVEDNGDGIASEEFLEEGGLAKLHHTSRSNRPQSYGRFGCFLASLAAVSVLAISSLHEESKSVYTLVFKHGRRLALDRTSDVDPNSKGFKTGTRVVVHNLFGAFPVRTIHQRQRYERRKEMEKDLNALKIEIAAILLASKRPFSIDIVEVMLQHRFGYRAPIFDTTLGQTIAVMAQLKLVPRAVHSSWRSISVQTRRIHVEATISLHLHPTRQLQFIAIEHQPIKSSESALYEQLNETFEHAGFCAGELVADRWPIFWIRVKTLDGQTYIDHDEILDSARDVVGELVQEFLRAHHFQTKTNKTSMSKSSLPSIRPSPFDALSRIKSAKSIDPKSFVSDLPFMSRSIGLQTSTRQTVVNARTGMALPGYLGNKPFAHILTRNIAETADIVRQSWSLATATEAQVTQSSDMTSMHITKHQLQHIRVIGQVDRKYILGTMDDFVVVIDQHAADERVRLEHLFSQIGDGHKTVLSETIQIQVEAGEVGQYETMRPYLSTWGVEFVVKHEADSKATICVTALHELIAERCRQEPQRLQDMLRTESWTESPRCYAPGQDWLSNITHCPRGILDMLVSRACRSAIMFNDVLTTAQAEPLIQQLSQCHFPFQCAHGRPSTTLLTKIHGLGYEEWDDFGPAWRAWTSE